MVGEMDSVLSFLDLLHGNNLLAFRTVQDATRACEDVLRVRGLLGGQQMNLGTSDIRLVETY